MGIKEDKLNLLQLLQERMMTEKEKMWRHAKLMENDSYATKYYRQHGMSSPAAGVADALIAAQAKHEKRMIEDQEYAEEFNRTVPTFVTPLAAPVATKENTPEPAKDAEEPVAEPQQKEGITREPEKDARPTLDPYPVSPPETQFKPGRYGYMALEQFDSSGISRTRKVKRTCPSTLK